MRFFALGLEDTEKKGAKRWSGHGRWQRSVLEKPEKPMVGGSATRNERERARRPNQVGSRAAC